MTHTQDILEFRSDLINQLILFAAMASVVELAILLSHVPTLGVTHFLVVRILAMIGLWWLAFFRHQINYFSRVSLLVGMTWISVVVHLVQFGPALSAKSLFITMTFFAMLFISERAGWVIVASIVGIFAGLGGLVTQGYIVYHFDYQAHILKPQTWIGMSFSLTAYSALTGYIAIKFLRFLERLLAQSRLQTEALREAKEKVEAANRAKQDFLNNMSHELNTPLHTILGYLQLLQDTALNWQQRGHLASIRQSSEHLHSLVNAILDTARLERQQTVLNPQPCCPLELLKHVTDMIQLKAQSKGLKFEFVQSQPLPAEILVDTLRLRQILLNLLTNAVKYTPKGFARLTVNCAELADKQAVLTFAVSDSGVGIPLTEQQRLLQPFERGNTLGQSGAGLGLSIVRQLLQQMDSHLKIDTSPAGSCFQFSLNVPVLRLDAISPENLAFPPSVPDLKTLQLYQRDLLFGRFPALKQQFEALAQAPPYQLFADQALQLINSGNKAQLHRLISSFFPTNIPLPQLSDFPSPYNPSCPKILVIDDDSFNVHLVAHYLRDFKFDLLSAFNGQEGLQLARHACPQLILLDIHMSGMTGFEVCQWLKADEHLRMIPVIFFSASNKPDDVAAAFAHQGQDYLFKPVREEEVIARVIAHLPHSDLQQPLINRFEAYFNRQTIDNNIAEQFPEETTSQSVETIDKIYALREVLLNNLQFSPKLEDIANEVGLNRNKLNEQFKVLFGDTVFAWLREQRLQRARDLLKDESLSIQDIAIQVGLSSQAQLSRMFKARFGQTPREYRLRDK
ncbi:MAG: hypothetical protein RIT27_1592 [Pseudomonadota bacterium]|jgi:signal transduction histidine kinase/DNA-binding response OmpR family regulator